MVMAMDYEKKYKEALKKVSELIRDYDNVSNLIDIKEELQNIFLELVESEDEKIMKEIAEFIYNSVFKPKDIKKKEKWLTWLEKQGEQMKTPEESLGIDSNTYNEIVDECIYGEQKPTDKVEPKFKVGDWVITNVYRYKAKIKAFIENDMVEFKDGTFETEENLVKDYHLWTIKDAKAGDVLSDGTTIFIFKDLLSDGSVMSYCDYDTDSGESDDFCPVSVNLMCSKIIPATNEQRDVLFAKMKEAGYEWDDEKKELRKIERKLL